MNQLLDMLARAFDAEDLERAREASLPHIVVCKDPWTGRSTFSGPYPSRREAQEVAAQESRTDHEAGSDLAFHVEPLYPPSGGDEPDIEWPSQQEPAVAASRGTDA